MTLRIAVFGENRHEKVDPKVQEIYPEGMHTVIAGGLRDVLAADGVDAEVRIALLDDIEETLSEEALAETDVLTWWGHMAHEDVPDEVVARVVRRVHEGMGLIPLHSAHYSKPFKALMGTTCSLLWRNEGEEERVWTVNGSHPIARGVPHPIVIPAQEMYGEMFDIPGARRARVRLLLRRRRGVPLRRRLPPRQGQGLLLQPRRPGVPRLPPERDPARAGQRRGVGPPRGSARPSP